VTVELGTMSHGSSVLSVSLDRALEAFTLGDSCGVYFIANLKDISFDLLCWSILLCVLKSELLYVSLSRNTGFCEMSLLSLCQAVAVNDLFLAAFIFVDDLVLLVNKSNLNCIVTVILNCLNLCYYTRTSLKNCYRCQHAVFVEDLCHSDFCS